MIIPSLVISAGAIISPMLFLHAATRTYDKHTVVERFEDIYASSGIIIVFLVLLAILSAFFLKNIYAAYWGSKGIYTYLTLPVKREAYYFSKLLTFTVCLMMLLAAQLLGVMLGYSVAAANIGSIDEGQFLMNNGLFLAFIRSEFLRILLPLSFNGLLSSISIMIALITGLYYGALCERSKRYYGFIFIAAAVVFIINVLNYRMERPVYPDSFTNLYPSSVTLLLLSGLFMWHSISLIKRGAIA
jgi:hypothetical protein